MTNNESDRLFEVAADTRGEPYEQDDLRQRTGFQSRAPRAGADFKEIALHRVIKAGAEIVRLNFEIDDIPVDAEVRGPNNRSFLVLARGTPYEHAQSGVRKTDTLEKAGFRAIHLARCQDLPIILITSDLPERSSKAGRYLSKLTNDVWDVVAYRLTSEDSIGSSVRSESRWTASLRRRLGARPCRAKHQRCWTLQSTPPQTATRAEPL